MNTILMRIQNANFSALPILQSPDSCASTRPEHIFSAAELAECAEGECCQCSRCCVVLHAFVPKAKAIALFNDPKRDRKVPLQHEKVSGEQCPQQDWQDGKAVCACHSQKEEAPILEGCNEFNGLDGGYDTVLKRTKMLLISPNNEDQVRTIQDWIPRGLFSDIDINLSRFELSSLLRNLLVKFDVFTEDIFSFLGVSGLIANYSDEDRAELAIILNCNLTNQTNSSKRFCTENGLGLL